MCQGGKPDTGKLHSSYIGMYVALPMRMCAWSMACVLWQQIMYVIIILFDELLNEFYVVISCVVYMLHSSQWQPCSHQIKSLYL